MVRMTGLEVGGSRYAAEMTRVGSGQWLVVRWNGLV